MLSSLRLPLLLAVSSLATVSLAQAANAPVVSSEATHTFTAQGNQFLYDGKPFQIIAGDMHYPRVPREYWRNRLHKAKAMGLNTLTTYAFWNVHEPSPGVYDFTGQNDLAEYLREAQQEGLHVILRPGPYVCAEWELGGYPSWLLKDRKLVLRSQDPAYTAAVGRWFMRLGKEIQPLLLKNGGPIIAVQLENEYGAFGNDLDYLKILKGQLIAAGMGDQLIFTSNQADDLGKGSLPELPAMVNFGSGNAASSIPKLLAYRPDEPHMVAEYWAGWFDKWGEEHHETDGKKEADEVHSMLQQGYSVSLYMFHGGTTFGWMNGADSHTGKDYHPDTTSYDYDAPLDEAGNPRYKYALLREAIADIQHESLPPVPAVTSAAVYPVSKPLRAASLWQNLPAPVQSSAPLTFEELNQNYGYVLYRKTLPAGIAGALVLEGMHDYAQVYLDHRLVGTLDRRLGGTTVQLPARAKDQVLDVLVENTGRVNYSHAILTEQTGLTGEVTFANRPLRDWQNFSLPMSDLSSLKMTSEPCSGPCFYEATLTVPAGAKPQDTYLDTSGLHKGQLWLGTHNLGRFWSIGPEFSLYTPAPWLKAGGTPIVFFDLMGVAGEEKLRSVAAPFLGATTHVRESQ